MIVADENVGKELIDHLVELEYEVFPSENTYKELATG